MGFFDQWEKEKREKKIDGKKTDTLASQASGFFGAFTDPDNLEGYVKAVGDIATDVGKGIVSTGQRVAGTVAQAGVGVAGAADTAASLLTGDEEGAQEKNKKYVKTMQDISDAKALDDGSMSFISKDTMSGKANPLEFGAEFTKAGAETAAFVQPELRAATLPKAIAAEAGVNAATNATATAADQLAKGEGLDGGEVAQSAIEGGILGGALRGIIGSRRIVKDGAVDQKAINAAPEATMRSDTGRALEGNQKPVGTVINAAQDVAEPPAPPLSSTINPQLPITADGPMTMSELAATANRPVGMSPGEFLREQATPKPQSMAAEVTPGPVNVLEGRLDAPGRTITPGMDTESSLIPNGLTDALNGQLEPNIVSRPRQVNDEMPEAPAIISDRSALPESSGLKGDDLKELETNLQPFVDERARTAESTGQKVDRSIGRYTQDFIQRSTKQLGKLGADVSKSMVKGSRVKSDIVNNLRPTMQDIESNVKKVAGKTETAQSNLMGKIGNALENRAEAQNMLTPEEYGIYQKVEKVYDTIMQERVARGLPVRQDYSPHEMIRQGSEAPTYLSDALQNRRTTADSRFSKERTDEDSALKTMTVRDLYNYVNSQATEFGYKEANDIYQQGLAKLSPEEASSPQFVEGIRNLNNAYSKAINPGSTSKLDRWLQKAQGNAYQAFLWNNPKNAAFNTAQTIIARGDVTREAKSLARSLDKDIVEEINKSKWFGDATVSADMAGEEPMTKLAQSLRKYDIGRASEERAVKQPFKLGFSQGISETQAYKDAIKDGKSKSEAVRIAMKDEDALKYAIDSGNVVVNNTSFGANTMARPEFLRDSSAVKRAFTMFMRFPIGMTNFAKEALNPKEARVVDVLMKGDPRAVPVAEMRNKYKTTLTALNDIEKAAKQGKFTDVPLGDIQRNISMMKDNIKIVDEQIKDLSSIRGGKRAAALAKMWGATAAIQFLWDGLTNPEEQDVGSAVTATNPTLLTNPLDRNSRFAGLSSPISPVTRYGQPNYRAVVNAIPGAGIANTMSNYVDGEGSGVLSDTLKKLIEGK